MAQPLFFRKKLGALVPADGAAITVLSKVRHGEDVQVEIKRPRNIRHHRKFFALVNLVFENQEHYASVEDLLAALKSAVGHCTLIDARDGGTRIAVPKSISFAKMDQAEFDAFYEKCLDVVARYFLPGVESDALRAEVEDLLS